ncbi:unnamed protein product [Adineta steineri]|uniref:EF-hand domain-containing protein n=1 Tax=Adineta steineri TaxID=433720 RepID=A0A814GL61_9BILA|nr:unnamed protein product [Adineta steineri]
MENLATITQADINNGALIRMLNKAGIPDIQEYIKHFHQETEELIIEEFEHPNADKLDNDEQIVPPADIQSWITGFRPNVDDPIKPVLFEQEQQPKPQPPLPKDIQGWITGLGPRLDDHNKPPSSEQEQQPKPQPPLPKDVQGWITGFGPRLDDHNMPPSSEQEQQPKPQPQPQPPLPKDIQGWITRLQPRPDDPIQPPLPQQQQSQEIPPPKDLQSWLHRMGPSNVHSSTETTIDTTEITTINNDINPANGDLGTWLNQWSKSLTEQPPPTSLDNWLKGLVPNNMHEPLSKANSSKGRLNSYLNAAEQVLSKHGYDVSNEVKPPANVQVKSGMFGNVKQMYFLWKTLDKNNDRKITVEDIQIMLGEMGLGFISKYAAKTLFEMVDTNHDGELQFRDFVALMGIIKQLVGAVGSAK